MRYWLPAVLYLGTIQLVSLRPDFQVPMLFPNVDKVIHVFEYLGLGILLVRALRASVPGRTPLFFSAGAVGLGLVVGAADEIVQRWTPGRISSLNDLLADVTGLLFAQVIYLLVVRDQAG